MKKIVERKKFIGALDTINHSLASALVSKLNEALEKDPNAMLVVNSTLNATLTSLASKELNVVYNEEVEVGVEDAPALSKNNRQNVGCGVRCGCYFCFRLFDGSEIIEFTDEGQTALCPHCDMDTIIPNIDDAAYLLEAGERWFTGAFTDPEEVTAAENSVPAPFTNFQKYYGPEAPGGSVTVKDISQIVSKNSLNIRLDTKCACFTCMTTFTGAEITKYDYTCSVARCPNCEYMTVIPETVVRYVTDYDVCGFILQARRYYLTLTGSDLYKPK